MRVLGEWADGRRSSLVVPKPCLCRGDSMSTKWGAERQGKDTCGGAVPRGSLVAVDDGEVHAAAAVDGGSGGGDDAGAGGDPTA